ncbi:uncharacterized protein LOC106162639 [Lingula anatina]|uniref:Integrin beta n=1 Tax=Lingula anatina TaxID=7574 RepID=A0A2R2MTB5_LINAN|nr:uncharacterized protein LOC106162639 [Lingula anatina]|eukprot:XP_023933489.1 uncharacterized protein LOC106162639 [Lingula anatina]
MTVLYTLAVLWLISLLPGVVSQDLHVHLEPDRNTFYVNIGDDFEVTCALDSGSLNGGTTFQWYRDDGTDPGTKITDTALPVDTQSGQVVEHSSGPPPESKLKFYQVQSSDFGRFKCIGSFNGTTSDPVVFSLEMREPITFTDAELTQTVTLHQEALVKCLATGRPAPKITWSFIPLGTGTKEFDITGNQADIYSETHEGLVIKNVTLGNEGTFVCEAESLNSTLSLNISVEVFEPLSWVTVPEDTQGYLNHSIAFTCGAQGRPEPQYKWFKAPSASETPTILVANSRVSLNSTSGQLTITAAQQSDAGVYTCMAEQSAGSNITISAILEVSDPAPRIVSFQNSTTLETSEGVMTCSAQGKQPINITFTKVVLPVPENLDETSTRITLERSHNDTTVSSTLRIANSIATDTGTYRCLADNDFGSDTSDATLTVEYQPRFTDTMPVANESQRFWLYDNQAVAMVTLMCKVDAVPPPSQWSWWKGTDHISNDANHTIVIDGLTSNLSIAVDENNIGTVSGVYHCNVYNSRGMAKHYITLTESTVPSKVTDIHINKTTSTTVQLIIDPPQDNGGLPVTDYLVDVAELSQTGTSRHVKLQIDSDLVITELKPNTTYVVKAKAVNAAGMSDQSEGVTVLTAPSQASAPGPLSQLNVTNVTSDSITLEIAPPSENGGLPITGYMVIMGTQHQSYNLNDTLTIHGLENGTLYNVQVMAVNAEGMGPPTAINVTTLTTDVVGTPAPTELPSTSTTVTTTSSSGTTTSTSSTTTTTTSRTTVTAPPPPPTDADTTTTVTPSTAKTLEATSTTVEPMVVPVKTKTEFYYEKYTPWIVVNDSNPCTAHLECGACIAAHRDCAWCKQEGWEDFHSDDRCDTLSKLQELGCTPDNIVNPNNKIVTGTSSADLFIGPPEVTITLKPGSIVSFTGTYAVPPSYLLDVYILLEVNYMDEDNQMKIYLESNMQSIANTLNTFSSDLRFGFGTFIDKPEMPFMSEERNQYCLNCAENCTCQPSSFQHVVGMTEDLALIEERVYESLENFSKDPLDAGLDALLQVILCKDQIGWRDKSRKVVLLLGRNTFHLAGEGKLAGAVLPYDDTCHLDSNGQYAEDFKRDYPSLHKVKKIVESNKVNVIFGVLPGVASGFRTLSEMVSGTVVEETAGTDIDRALLSGMQALNSKLELRVKDDPVHSDVQLHAECQRGNAVDERNKTLICENLGPSDVVNFRVTVTVDKCPLEDHVVYVSPIGIGEEVKVSLHPLCTCPCEATTPATMVTTPATMNASPECSSNGVLSCGSCVCNEGYFGRWCECNLEKLTNSTWDQCRSDENSSVCFGQGECFCGSCYCNRVPGERVKFDGDYCFCDNTSCPRDTDFRMCGGPLQGNCVCGSCECEPGFSGDACQCNSTSGTLLCTSSNGLLCNGKGDCRCGRCYCDVNSGYSGPTCEICPTCREVRCPDIISCIRCTLKARVQEAHVYHSPEVLEFEAECDNICRLHEIQTVSDIREADLFDFVCRVPTGHKNCFNLVTYKELGQEKVAMKIKTVEECPMNETAMYDLIWKCVVIDLAILVLVLLILLLWRLIVWCIDRNAVQHPMIVPLEEFQSTDAK